MSTTTKHISTLSTSLVIGAALGAALGMLFAPENGTRTRRKLRRYAKRSQVRAAIVGDELKDALDRATRYCKELVA